MKFFNFYEKLMQGVLFFFWGGGEFCFKVFGPKEIRNGLKMKFSKFYERSVHGTFLVFAWSSTA